MNEVWNLEKIYQGFDDPAFEGDLTALKEEIAAYTELAGKIGGMDPLEGLRTSTRMEEQVTRRVMKLIDYASLRQSADSRDADAGSQMGRIMAAYSGVAAPSAAITDWAAKLPNLMELVDGDEELKRYHFRFRKMQRSSKYLLSGLGETIMAKMGMSGSSAGADMRE